MSAAASRLLICSCEKTMPLDAEAIGRGCTAKLGQANQLCGLDLVPVAKLFNFTLVHECDRLRFQLIFLRQRRGGFRIAVRMSVVTLRFEINHGFGGDVGKPTKVACKFIRFRDGSDDGRLAKILEVPREQRAHRIHPFAAEDCDMPYPIMN